MRLPTLKQMTTVLVFVSSGDDVPGLRDLVSRLAEGINWGFRAADIAVRLEVDRWEHTAPHRVPEGETLNHKFVERARAAAVVLCLLHQKLGDGTREEVEVALAEKGVELSVVWCVEDGDWPDTEVGRWLDPLKEQILIKRPGPLGTDGPTVAIVQILLEAALTAAQHTEPEGLLRERR